MYPPLDIPDHPIDELMNDPNKDEDAINPNERRPQRLLDSPVQRDDELSDSEDEGEGGRKNHASHRDADSTLLSPTGTRRFGLGVGIMGAAPPGVGSAAAGSGGPSAHHAAPPVKEKDDVIDLDAMDVDDENAGVPDPNKDATVKNEPAGSEPGTRGSGVIDATKSMDAVENGPAPTLAAASSDAKVDSQPAETS